MFGLRVEQFGFRVIHLGPCRLLEYWGSGRLGFTDSEFKAEGVIGS